MLKMLQRYVSIVILLVLAVVSFGCASFGDNAYKAIGVTVAAVDAARGVYSDMYPLLLKEGKITAEQDAKIEAAYKTYQVAARAAIAAVRVYQASVELKQDPSPDKVNTALVQLQDAGTKFLVLLRSFGVIK